MLISFLCYRMPSQRAVVALRTWTVANGTEDLVRVQWDPRGPLSREEAALAALELARTELIKRMQR